MILGDLKNHPNYDHEYYCSHLNEEKMIKGISEIFKMPNNLVESIKIQFFEVNKQYNLKDDYKVLLSSPNDTDTELKKKYQNKIYQF